MNQKKDTTVVQMVVCECMFDSCPWSLWFATLYKLLMDAISVSNHHRGLISTDVLLYPSDLFGLLRN
jgi:hypothetical protein